MKKLHILTFSLSLTAGLLSCTSEEHIHPSLPATSLTITASHPGDVLPETKTTLLPNGNNPKKGLTVAWAKNDLIKLVRSVDNQYSATDLMLVSGAEQKSATFSGNAIPALDGNAIYQAFYPATKGGETSEEWKKNATYEGQVQRGYNDTRHLSAYDYLQTVPTETLSEDFRFYHCGMIFCFDLTMPETIPAIPLSLTLATTDATGAFIADGGLFCDNNSTPTSAIALGFAECEEAVTQFQAYMTLACNIQQEQTLSLILTLSDGNRYAHKLKAKQSITSPTPGESKSGISYFIPITTWEKMKASTLTGSNSITTPQGDGTKDSPYIITKATDLKYLTSNNSGKYYRLATDIIIADNAEWKSIGSSTNKFSGHFDGNGHTIKSNLIKNSIFGYTEKNASIRNLTVISNIANESNTCIGGIIGNADNTTITNCHYQGTISYNKITENQLNIGCIVGKATKNCTILNCTSHGEIQDANKANTKAIYSGGIVGNLSTPGEIMNCNNYATIEGSTSAQPIYTGGIVGNITPAMNSSATASITGCTNYGKVYNGSAEFTTSCGGIAGNATNAIFTDVRNIGDIKAIETKGINNIGGIIGDQGKATSLFRAINSGNVTGYSNGTKASRTGGLVGNANSSAGTIHQCYNEGNVSTTGTINSNVYIGAYIGYSTAPNIFNCCHTVPQATIQATTHDPLPLQKCTEKHTRMQ